MRDPETHRDSNPGGGDAMVLAAGVIRVAAAVDAPARAEILIGVLDRLDDIRIVALDSLGGAPPTATGPRDVVIALASSGSFRAAPAVEAVMARFADAAAPPAVVGAALDVDTEDARRALAAGARGYLTVADGMLAVEEAVRAVAHGGEWVGPSIGVALAREEAHAAALGLEPRDRDVLRLLALGYTNAEAAEALRYSVRTIEGVRASVCRRLGLTSRRELVAVALDLGLLDRRAA
jgi:DNA-binding NarL/FixJ family response regulator